MAKKKRRLSMHKVKEMLRLRFEAGLSFHKIAQSLSVSSSTVSEVLVRAKNTGLEWSVLHEMDEDKLKAMLYPSVKRKHAEYGPEPDYKHVYLELCKKSVTLLLLWEEYIQEHPDGYRYSYFCELYQKWCRSLNISLRQAYKAGEKMFLDYAGQTVPVIDLDTCQERAAQVFVAVLGASSYTYSEATWSQDLPSWISSHAHTLEYFCGTPEIWVPDNLRSGVSHSCRYEPGINPTYQDMAKHYGAVVIPARVKKPRDKGNASDYTPFRL
jgi:transposase